MRRSPSPTETPVPAPPATTGDAGHPQLPLQLWAALVYEARRARGLSQPQLAQAAGVAQQTISKLERGMLCPHDRIKLRLAAALGVQPALLFPWPSLTELDRAARTIALEGALSAGGAAIGAADPRRRTRVPTARGRRGPSATERAR